MYNYGRCVQTNPIPRLKGPAGLAIKERDTHANILLLRRSAKLLAAFGLPERRDSRFWVCAACVGSSGVAPELSIAGSKSGGSGFFYRMSWGEGMDGVRWVDIEKADDEGRARKEY
jgi:hypothetical protein